MVGKRKSAAVSGLDGRLRALVVEDNATVRRAIVEFLRAAGVTSVRQMGTGRMALEDLKIAPVDLVITDLAVPDMDGVELTKRIRNGAAGPMATGVPVVMLAGHGSPQAMKAALQAGVDDILVKPVVAARLAERLERAIEAGRQRAQKAVDEALAARDAA
jgi:CheY-like chemotaxis protein